MADDTAFTPATRLLALYRSRQLSPVEVIEQTLQTTWESPRQSGCRHCRHRLSTDFAEPARLLALLFRLGT